MRRDSPLGVFQRGSITLPDAGEKLMQDVIPIECYDAVFEILKCAWFLRE
jgi:hypothetical protein